MKFPTQPAAHGNVLVITLLTTAIIGTALASYLTMASNQNLSVSRSLAWNGAVPVTESGIEEALTQLYYNGITNLSANGWTALTNGWYYKKRYVDNTSYYEVNINPVNPPVIVSTGYAPAPLAPTSGFGMIFGQAAPQTSSSPYLKRRVRVTTIGGSSMGAA